MKRLPVCSFVLGDLIIKVLNSTYLYFHVLLVRAPVLLIGLVILRGIVCLYVVMVIGTIARVASLVALLSILRRNEPKETHPHFGHP
jgi:hypothetical protein